MGFTDSVSLHGRHVSLVPLEASHHDDLVEAVKDGELWELWYTSVPAPDGIEFEVPQPTRVVVRGISKQQVGEIAAKIRKQRPPEPYKGKGIRYEGEVVARKVGKRA